MARLDIGDKVTWTSQAGGHTKTKIGYIVHIVPADTWPSMDDPRFRELDRKNRYYTVPRNHESYVVEANCKYYFPRVSGLKLIN